MGSTRSSRTRCRPGRAARRRRAGGAGRDPRVRRLRQRPRRSGLAAPDDGAVRRPGDRQHGGASLGLRARVQPRRPLLRADRRQRPGLDLRRQLRALLVPDAPVDAVSPSSRSSATATFVSASTRNCCRRWARTATSFELSPSAQVLEGDYVFDIDAVGDLARNGHDLVARVDVPIGHLFSPTYGVFARKTRRRARDFLYYSGRGERSYPWTRYRRGLGLFVLATVTTVPLLAQSAVGYSHQRDRAWWFHPVACWTTLAIYGWEAVRARIKPEKLTRRDWRQ